MGKPLILLKWARTGVSGFKLEDQSEPSEKEVLAIFEWAKNHMQKIAVEKKAA